MHIENIDQLYQLVLQGRELGVWTNVLLPVSIISGLVALLLWFILMGYFLTNVEDAKTPESQRELVKDTTSFGWVCFAVTAVSCAIFGGYCCIASQRAKLPVDSDIKTVGPYIIGEQVVKSDKFDRMSEAIINYIENKPKDGTKEGS